MAAYSLRRSDPLELMERARIEDLDLEYAHNVRACCFLTQRLLPILAAAGMQIVFKLG